MAEELPLKKTMVFTYGVAQDMAPGVRRLVANNPGPFTFKGTNSYLIGTSELALIDPGPDLGTHIDAIMAAAGGRPITHIVITHAHRDHTDALAPLLQRLGAGNPARTCGFARGAGDLRALEASPTGKDFIDADLKFDIVLADGDTVAGPDWTLRALHTPGHAPDHLCFALEGTGIMFSGDHVMSWNTSVVAPPEGDMADYMASLELLVARDDSLYLPGHGGRLAEPQRAVRAFLVHRQWREQAILTCIRDGTNTIAKIVALVYRGLDKQLHTAAALSVLAHVEHLIARGLVTCDGVTCDGVTCDGAAAIDRVLYAA